MGNSETEKHTCYLMEAVTTILSIASLEIGYTAGNSRKVILSPLNAEAGKGEIVAVFGRNGIGKSTLLRTIAGLQHPLGGLILLNGKDLKEHSRNELAKTIGYISTEVIRVSKMRVYDLVALGRFPYTNWVGKIDERSNGVIMGAIERTGMELLKDRYISELSDGERQRAMIARVIAQETDIIIMDEPTAFLDIAGKYEIISLLQEVAGEGRTIVFSTHDFNIALSNADKIWLIHNEGLLQGSPEDLVIDGTFEHLFNSGQVSFNSADGTLNFRKQPRGEIYVEGDSIVRTWTERALQRAGYSISSEKTDPFIKVIQDTGGKTICFSGDNKIHFDSIYELVSYLRRNEK